MQQRTNAPRGYVLMVVVVLGIVLASIAAILIYATGRDRAEGKQQQSSVRAVYAAEAAVAVGIEHLRELLEQKTAPSATDLDDVEQKTIATLGASLSSATFPVLSVKYYDSVQNTVADTPISSSNALVTITEGPNKGLRAQQTPIQVLATAKVNQASASVADAIRVDLIPVFQFAIFFDGDLEAQRPARMEVSGRVHTNGQLYLSNGEQVDFKDTVTVAGKVHSHSSFDTGTTVGSGSTATTFRRLSDGTQVAIANNLPRADADQKSYLESTYGIGGGLQDTTTGAEPLSIPLRLSSAATCTSDASCGVGRSCVKVRVTDPSGVCTDNVTSRPDVCGNGNVAEFAQSLAIEIIKRPAAEYSSAGSGPYALGINRDATSSTSPYRSDYGPMAAVINTGAARGANGVGADPNDIIEVAVARKVPVLTSTPAQDDPGAVVDRLYWKAHIRIIDGVWYRGDGTVIFNPEVDAPGLANPSPTADLQHAFARAIRYSWWWDVRENRVYCDVGGGNCVDDGRRYHRGVQIRSADFDVAAFMALLERSDARARMFPGGTIPGGGIVLYMSETYDPKYEDANTRVARAANVRNFLNFPIMHNHLSLADISGGAHASITGLARKAPDATTSTPHQLGWFPENLWGRNAPTGYESLTRPTGSADDVAELYAVANPTGSKNGSTCAIPGSDFTSSRRPSARPTSFATMSITPTCVQVGAQPMGPENAVRVIRAQTIPEAGFTFVTDNRLYVHGDVNVRSNSTVTSGSFATSQDIGGRVAFIADSLTIQSERFDDRAHQSLGGTPNLQSFHRAPTFYGIAATALPWATTPSPDGAPPNFCDVVSAHSAFETRINASLLMGDVPACLRSGNALGNPSGGVNNFPRFVERWQTGPENNPTQVALLLNGSMVGLFRSERGNARFLNAQTRASGGVIRQDRAGSAYDAMQNANICDYRPPKRNWTFDPILLTGIDRLPPGTPRVVATDRLRWVRR